MNTYCKVCGIILKKNELFDVCKSCREKELLKNDSNLHWICSDCGMKLSLYLRDCPFCKTEIDTAVYQYDTIVKSIDFA